MLKGIVDSAEKQISDVKMLDGVTEKDGWEVRDSQDRILWGAIKTLTGVSSISFSGYGLDLTGYTISGNMTQTGSEPVVTEECGDRTAQLFDVNNIVDGGDFYPSNTYESIVASSNTSILLIPCKPSTTYTISRKTWITKRFAMCFVTSSNLYDGMPISGFAGSITDSGNLTATATSAANSQYMVIYYAKHGGSDSSTQSEIQAQLNELMVNEGGTALTYEPYGYKITITIDGQTSALYIDEPIRKAIDGSDVVDEIKYPDNVIIRRVGSDGGELSTPTEDSIVLPVLSTSEGSNAISIGTTLSPSGVSITGHIKDVDWLAVRRDVRSGNAPTKYPVGTVLYDNFDSETGTAFQVVGYDKHFDPVMTSAGYTHSMTLCELKLDDVITFDAPEAFLYLETELPAGTYKFTIPNYDSTYGGNKTYYFSTEHTVPVGGQIVMNWPYNETPQSVSTYAGGSSTTAIESGLTLSEWVDGTSPDAVDIGTIAGPSTQAGASEYGQMNHIHRARYGSNNYKQSGIRQYLNSNSAGNTWWTPQTVFDRPYKSSSSAGKLTKINQKLVNIMVTPTITSKANGCFETTSIDGTTFTLSTDYSISTDKVFLLSPMEVNLSADTSVGSVLDYYVNATDGDRIKNRASNNTAYHWWVRTPSSSSANSSRRVYKTGSADSGTVDNSYGVAMACVIQ